MSSAAPQEQQNEDKTRLRLVSDLHLFSRRSQADKHLSQIQEAASDADLFVFAGDTFDYKWAHTPTEEAFADHAEKWISELAEKVPECSFHYLLGNHDHHPALIDRLEILSERYPNLAWDPYFLRRPSTIFLHGDVAMGLPTTEQLERFRKKWQKHKRKPGAIKNRIYDAIVAARLHSISAGIMFPPKVVARRITKYLEHIGHGAETGLQDVYFGHTHRALEGFEYGGLRFHNAGAPIKGHRFRILDAEID